MSVLSVKGIDTIINKHARTVAAPEYMRRSATQLAYEFHGKMPNYNPTPLRSLEKEASRMGVQGFYIKDESERFGLKAFKALGGVYAISKVLCELLELDIEMVDFETLKLAVRESRYRGKVFVTATDGNHGKGVAWAAHELGCLSEVYMPVGSSEYRAAAIRKVGGEVEITDLSYDDTVKLARSRCADIAGVLIQDGWHEGYERIPRFIMQGYATMAYEIAEQMKERAEVPTHVFLQAGVGSMAASMVAAFTELYTEAMPKFIIVEPTDVACIYESGMSSDGRAVALEGVRETIMAGLNCGTACTLAWEILRDRSHSFVRCPDYVSAEGMRFLAKAGIVSGESGAVTSGLAYLLCTDDDMRALRESIGLDEKSVVLTISTEGDTDPEHYLKVMEGLYEKP